MGILYVDRSKINVDDVDFDKDDAKSIIHVKLTAWGKGIKQRKAFRKWYKQRINACSMAF